MKTFMLCASLLFASTVCAMLCKKNKKKLPLTQFPHSRQEEERIMVGGNSPYLSDKHMELKETIAHLNTRKKCLFFLSFYSACNATKDLFVYSDCGRTGFAPAIPANGTSSPTGNSSLFLTVLQTVSNTNPVIENVVSFAVNTVCALGSFCAALYSWRQECKAKKELEHMEDDELNF